MEVHDYDLVPQKMESFDLVGGKYAVFLYKNTAGMAIFEWIFREWLPNSEFDLDDRPHFEVFGEKSIQKDPEAMEEIWIPVKNKLN